MNTRIIKYFSIIISSIIISSLFYGCGTTAQLQSSWNNGEIKIDGNPSEWQSSAFMVEDEGVILNFKNDDEFLYICLITNNQGKMTQMMRSGFIVWFDPNSDESRIFGIKYPMQVSLIDREERREFNKQIFRDGDMKNHFTKMIEDAKEFQILNENNFPLGQLPIENNEGIKVKLGLDSERFVYELQVPIELSKQYQNRIAARPGEKVKINFETLDYEFDGIPSGGMKPRGEREGFGGQRPQGGMRRSEGKQFEKPEPFNFKAEILLQKQE